MQLYYETLQQIVEFSPQQMLANKHNLYSLLINIHLSDKWLEKCENEIFNRIFTQIDTDEYWELPLVLLVSKSLPLIDAYNTYLESDCENDPFKKRNAFFMATKRGIHFLEAITQNGDQEFKGPDFLRDVVRLIKLALLISNKPTRVNVNFNFYEEVWKQFEQINVANLSDSQRIFYYEFARMLSLHHFVRRRHEYSSDSIAIKVLASRYNILDFFVKFNDGTMITNTNDYRYVRRQLVENGVFNAVINPNVSTDMEKPSEVYIYDQFYTINLMVEVLLIRPMTRNYEDIIQAKSAEIKTILDNIHDPLAYIQLSEHLFMLLFLRWEHVTSRYFSNTKSDQSTSATTSVTHSDSSFGSSESVSIRRAGQLQPNVKDGFVCTFTALKYMLCALNSSMASRTIDNLSDALRKRFENMSDAIQDAKWRLQLVDSFYMEANSIRASSDLKIMLTAHIKRLNNAKVCSSSDESESNQQRAAFRRKPRRRNKIKNYDSNTQLEATDFKTKTSIGSESISVVRYASHRDRRKCFISKMLGKLTDMVTIAVIRNDFTNAKSLIEVRCELLSINAFFVILLLTSPIQSLLFRNTIYLNHQLRLNWSS